MTLHTINSEIGLGGGAGLHGDEVLGLVKALQQLQSVATQIVNGAGSNVDIVVPGLAADSTLGSVIEYVSGVPTDRTSVSTIDSSGNLNVAAVTTGNKLVVTFYGA